MMPYQKKIKIPMIRKIRGLALAGCTPKIPLKNKNFLDCQFKNNENCSKLFWGKQNKEQIKGSCSYLIKKPEYCIVKPQA